MSIEHDRAIVTIRPPLQIIEDLRSEFDLEVWKYHPHVTLASLGRITQGRLQDILMVLENEVIPTLQPLKLDITGYGIFRGSSERVRVALINGKGLDLWALKVRHALNRHGYWEGEDYGFLPHMTLSYSTNLPDSTEIRSVIDISESWTQKSLTIQRGLDAPIDLFLREGSLKSP